MSKTFTILEIAETVGAALAAPASADSAAKGKSRVADRRRKEMKEEKRKNWFLEKKPYPLRGVKELLGK